MSQKLVEESKAKRSEEKYDDKTIQEFKDQGYTIPKNTDFHGKCLVDNLIKLADMAHVEQQKSHSQIIESNRLSFGKSLVENINGTEYVVEEAPKEPRNSLKSLFEREGIIDKESNINPATSQDENLQNSHLDRENINPNKNSNNLNNNSKAIPQLKKVNFDPLEYKHTPQ